MKFQLQWNFEDFYQKMKRGEVEPIDALSFNHSDPWKGTGEATHHFRIKPKSKELDCSQKNSTFVCFELISLGLWKVARFDEKGPKYYA